MAALDALVARLSRVTGEREARWGRRAGNADRAREGLRRLRADHLVPLLRTIRVLRARDPEQGLALLSLPKANGARADLLDVATALLGEARTHRERLASSGMPSDTAERIEGAIAAVQGCVRGTASAAAGRVGLTAALADLLAEGRQQLELLDVEIRQSRREDAEYLAAWRSAAGGAPIARVEAPVVPEVPPEGPLLPD